MAGNAYEEYKCIRLMIDDLNDMYNNPDVSEWECMSYKNSVIDEINVYNRIHRDIELSLVKCKSSYKLGFKALI